MLNKEKHITEHNQYIANYIATGLPLDINKVAAIGSLLMTMAAFITYGYITTIITYTLFILFFIVIAISFISIIKVEELNKDYVYYDHKIEIKNINNKDACKEQIKIGEIELKMCIYERTYNICMIISLIFILLIPVYKIKGDTNMTDKIKIEKTETTQKIEQKGLSGMRRENIKDSPKTDPPIVNESEKIETNELRSRNTEINPSQN